MEYNSQYIASLLNESYTFQSILGKNINFQDSIETMPFYFFSNESYSKNFLSLHAGGEITYTVPVRYTQAPLPYSIIFFITQGEATMTFLEHTITLSQNDIVILPANFPLNFSTSLTPFSYKIFYLSGTVFQDFSTILFGEQGFYNKKHVTDSMILQLFATIESLLVTSSAIAPLHITSVFNLLFSVLADLKEQETLHTLFPKYVIELKKILDLDYPNAHSLESLEERIGINKYRLCRDFSKYIGMAPMKYLTLIRLREAKRLLCVTTLTIREVGISVGIENTTHFINLFKKNTGITPLQFRQTYSH